MRKFPLQNEILQNVTFIDPRNRTSARFEQAIKLIVQIPKVIPEDNINDMQQEFLGYRSGVNNLGDEERIDEFWERMSEKTDPVTLKPIYPNVVSIAIYFLLH